MTRKGQSAMEYLMTYGWAILVIIIVIAVLFYIGVLNPRNVTPTSCTFPPGLTCSSYKLLQWDGAAGGELELRIGQATGHTMKITAVACTQQSNPTDVVADPLYGDAGAGADVTIPQGEQRWISGTQDPNLNQIFCVDGEGAPLAEGTSQLGEFYKGKIWIWYTETGTLMTRTVVGDIAAKFEQ